MKNITKNKNEYKTFQTLFNVGPVIKNGVFDAFFGVLCSLLLISGGYTRSPGLIVTWMLVTIIASVKYIWIFFVSDWSSLEDWIAITYLLFYTFVFLIVFSFLAEITSWRRNQGPAFGQPYEGHYQGCIK